MKRPRLGWALALACVIAAPVAFSQTTTGTFTIQRFADYINSLGAASSLSATDGVAIRQNGVMKKWLPFNYFLDHTASNVADPAAARTNLGAMARDASNVNTATTARGNLSAMARDAADASLPDARSNLLYTPPSCDGFVASDGGITAGTNIFTSASATFTAADVGKPISIRKAGAKFFMDSAAVSSGGSGHSVGDLVNFADDIQVFVVTVSGGAVTSFYIVNKGSAATNSATIAQTDSIQTGSPVAGPVVTGGSDLVITPTWVRENLVTTIASVTNPITAVLTTGATATVSSADWGYGSDYGPTIQAALTAKRPVLLPTGICGHASTLTLQTSATLIGQGRSLVDADRSGTALLWLGAPNNTQLFVGDETTRHSYINVGWLTLDGLGAASKGDYWRGAVGSKFTEIVYKAHTTVGHDIHGNTDDVDSIENSFDHLLFTYDAGGFDLNTVGMWWGWPNTIDMHADHDLSLYTNVQIKTRATIPGFMCGAADHNVVTYLQVRAGTGNFVPPGIEMFGSNWATNGHCRAITFLGMDSGQGGLKVRATGYAKVPVNMVEFYPRDNGSPFWSVETGATLVVKDNYGINDQLRLKGHAFADLQTPPAHGGFAYITDSNTKTPGAIAAAGGSYSVPVFWDGTNWRVSVPMATKASANINHQTPVGTTSATFVMMGLGATATITPTLSGTVLMNAWGAIDNSLSGDTSRARLKYGTGAAPANGVAETGTSACTGTPGAILDTAAAGQRAPFSMTCIVTGLTPGTPYWIDLGVASVGGGLASLTNVSVQAMEQ